SSLQSQVCPRHFAWPVESEHAQHRRAHVAQRTAFAQRPIAVRIDNDEWYWVRGMRSVRATGLRIDHHLTIAVVGGDEQSRANGLSGLHNSLEASIDRLHGRDRCWY